MYGELVAKLLWETGAVKVNLKEPFRLVSGNYSPVYIDCRKLISDPEMWCFERGFFWIE